MTKEEYALDDELYVDFDENFIVSLPMSADKIETGLKTLLPSWLFNVRVYPLKSPFTGDKRTEMINCPAMINTWRAPGAVLDCRQHLHLHRPGRHHQTRQTKIHRED